MRDPARIGPTLDTLREVWEENPDMRLGQLIYNAVREVTPEGQVPPNVPVFYIEEPRLLDGLQQMRRPAP